MTLDELRNALNQAQTTGKIGTPVAARVHLQIVEPFADPAVVLPTVLQMLAPCFPETPTSIRVRQSNDASQWNLLLQNPSGQSLFITLGSGAVKNATVHLLVIGNHGLIRLEGSDGLQFTAADAAPKQWTAAIAEGNRSGRVVSLSPDGSPSR